MPASVKLARQGNSTGVTLPKESLDVLGWQRGDEVVVSIVEDHIEIRRADGAYHRAMESVQRCFGRYPRALKKLAE